MKKNVVVGLKRTLKRSSGVFLCMLTLASCSKTENIFNFDKGNGNTQDKGYMVANFESENMTPCIFRFGNNIGAAKRGQEIDLNFKPRWVYSHEVVANPVKDEANNSERVLKIHHLWKVRNFGIKIRFPETYAPTDIKECTVQIVPTFQCVG